MYPIRGGRNAGHLALLPLSAAAMAGVGPGYVPLSAASSALPDRNSSEY
jgi:hypothetical protein